MNAVQFSAALRQHFADHGLELPETLHAAIVGDAQELGAHLVEQFARPPGRDMRIAGAT